MRDEQPSVQRAIGEAGVAISLVPEADIQAFVQAHAAELEEPICVILTGENIAREGHRRLISVAADS